MRRPLAFWAASISGLVLLDLWCDRQSNDSTLSACTRAAFRTHTVPGKVTFAAAWMAFAYWFLDHICRT
jgi:hypothetical protein